MLPESVSGLLLFESDCNKNGALSVVVRVVMLKGVSADVKVSTCSVGL